MGMPSQDYTTWLRTAVYVLPARVVFHFLIARVVFHFLIFSHRSWRASGGYRFSFPPRPKFLAYRPKDSPPSGPLKY